MNQVVRQALLIVQVIIDGDGLALPFGPGGREEVITFAGAGGGLF